MAKHRLLPGLPNTYLYGTLFLFFNHFMCTLSQLVGCDTIKCPVDNTSSPVCQVGNHTMTTIGIASFNSSFVAHGSQNLTLAMGIQKLIDPNDDKSALVDQIFYLGAPPNVDIRAQTSFAGCAILWRGLAPSLNFSTGNIQRNIGVCEDAVGTDCVRDLNSQVSEITSGFLGSMLPDNLCLEAGLSLRSYPPASCRFLPNDTTESVWTLPIAGPFLRPPRTEDECRPTTESNYTLFELTSYRTAAPVGSQELKSILNGITMVSTVFYPNASAKAPKNISFPDVSLTCLKAVDNNFSEMVVSEAPSSLNNFTPLSLLIWVAIFSTYIFTL